jgi:hypothetical protein
MDHPRISIPEGITYTYNKVEGSFYFSDLLCEIFLAKVVSSKIGHKLIKISDIEDGDELNFNLFSKRTQFVSVLTC